MQLLKSNAGAPSEPTILSIEAVSEPTILQYFATLNAGDFAATSRLFALDGAMHPPFEEPLVGHEAIHAYLSQEATGMILSPQEAIVQPQPNDNLEIQVRGQVQTAWFGVNVAWLFVLNPQRQITLAVIKLLASPQELLNLRR